MKLQDFEFLLKGLLLR